MNEHNPHHAPPPPGGAKAAGRVEEARPVSPPPPDEQPLRPPHVIRIGGRTIHMPASRWVRIGLGSALVVFGLLGFLPILGFWMVPLGLLILSIDLAIVRRWRRRSVVRFQRRFPGTAARLRRWMSPSHLRNDQEHR